MHHKLEFFGVDRVKIGDLIFDTTEEAVSHAILKKRNGGTLVARPGNKVRWYLEEDDWSESGTILKITREDTSSYNLLLKDDGDDECWILSEYGDWCREFEFYE